MTSQHDIAKVTANLKCDIAKVTAKCDIAKVNFVWLKYLTYLDENQILTKNVNLWKLICIT